MWPFRKTIKYKIKIDLSDSAPQIDDPVVWWDDMKPDYRTINGKPVICPYVPCEWYGPTTWWTGTYPIITFSY